MSIFWEVIASNALVATALALIAWLLGRVWKNPAAIHAMWLVVLLKLFTPPLLMTELPFTLHVAPSAASIDRREKELSSAGRNEQERTGPVTQTNSQRRLLSDTSPRTPRSWFREAAVERPWSLSALLSAIWIFGAGCLAVIQTLRILRFTSVVRSFGPAPLSLRRQAIQLANRLGLKRAPDVLVTSRTLPPLVWSIGFSRPRVILPFPLVARLSGEAQATILAHELIHICRGDHLVRFLELAATTLFWWHPVVWWAGSQLRELEEQCCDGRVLELSPHQPRTYAAALVETLEFLSEQPRTRVPLPTAIHSSGSLSRRLRMLTQNRVNRLSVQSATLVAGLVAFPLVIAFAADPPQAGKAAVRGQSSAGAASATLQGRVTNEAGAPLADVRVRIAIPAKDMRFVNFRTHDKLVEAKTDAKGDYHMKLPEITRPTTVSLDAMKPGYRRLVGTLMSGGDPKSVKVGPGIAAEASLILKPALYFAGVVVNDQGKPISGAKISAQANSALSSGGIEITHSNGDGSFEIFNYPQEPVEIGKQATKGVIYFFHPDYVDQKIDNVYALSPHGRTNMRIVLPTGHKLAGTVLDTAGNPVSHAMVKAIRDQQGHRKATTTDAQGKFVLRGLASGPTTLSVRALAIKQKTQLPIVMERDKSGLEVRLHTIALPAKLKTYTVLGMQLADVTPELKSAYDLYPPQGAVIVDPGQNSDRLEIGDLAEGNCFWIVGEKKIEDVRDFVERILAEFGRRPTHRVRVVYTFSSLEGDGTNTQHLKLTNDDIKQLQTLLDQFKAAPK